MSGYTTFAILGAGNVGIPIVEAFIAEKKAGGLSEVLVLLRPESVSKDSAKALAAKGAKVVGVDYASKDALKEALTGVDVVISTLGGPALAGQVTIAEAAKDAGAKLFVPSEFGAPSDALDRGIMAGKFQLQAKFNAVGIPILYVYTGAFADWVWNPFMDLQLSTGKITLPGDGNARVSFTTRPDIGRYLAYVLTKLPASKLQNRTIRIEGDNKSPNEVVKLYEERTGKKLEVKYLSVEEIDAACTANAFDIVSLLRYKLAMGRGIVGPNDNSEYPGWNPTPVIDAAIAASS